MNQKCITNKQVLQLSALLKCQASKNYKKYHLLHKGAIGATAIGLGSLALGVVSAVNKMPEIAQTSLAIGLYGTLGGFGFSGVCNKHELSAFEKACF